MNVHRTQAGDGGRDPRPPEADSDPRRAGPSRLSPRPDAHGARPRPRHRRNGLGEDDDARRPRRPGRAEEKLHVVTIEDPVEYEHRHRRSVVEQIEIGADAPDFATALVAALRQDPDVLLVGEMRDEATARTV